MNAHHLFFSLLIYFLRAKSEGSERVINILRDQFALVRTMTLAFVSFDSVIIIIIIIIIIVVLLRVYNVGETSTLITWNINRMFLVSFFMCSSCALQLEKDKKFLLDHVRQTPHLWFHEMIVMQHFFLNCLNCVHV